MKKSVSLALCLVLSSCSGGSTGGGGTPAPAPTPAPSPTPTPPPPLPACTGGAKFCWPQTQPSAVSTAAAKPRVILTVMLDDADYHDVGYYSADAVTPNIDLIARHGLTLGRFYASAPMCSPTRAAFITGNSPARYGITRLWPELPPTVKGDYHVAKRGLPESDRTLAQALGAEGYRSLHIGKWHIGNAETRFLPAAKGFDKFELMALNQFQGTMNVRTEAGNKQVNSFWRPAYQADRIISEINSSLSAGQNVYINWWPYEPHALGQQSEFYYVPPTFNRTAFDADAGGKTIDLSTNRGKLVAQLHAFDAEFGRVITHLKQRGVFDDSLVIVTSDNGGIPEGIGPFREVSGTKETLSEGGIRVPFAASWPKRFSAGTHSDLPMSTYDIYPTIMALIGAAVPTGITGQDMSSLLLNGTGQRSAMSFLFRRADTRRNNDDRVNDAFALIEGCDKIVQAALVFRLFDVCSDPLERTDLAATKPARFDELRALLRERRRIAAQYLALGSLTAPRTLPADERLDFHHDDFSIYATVNLSGVPAGGTYTIYRRGDGIQLQIQSGVLTATVTGVADSSTNPAFRTVRLTAPIPNDGSDHRIGFVIHGYLFAGSTLSLYIDRQLVARAAAPLNASLDPGQSILAVKSERTQAQAGDSTLSLRNYLLLTTALEPDDF
jgi:arylsulfatase A-like enzyme